MIIPQVEPHEILCKTGQRKIYGFLVKARILIELQLVT